MFRNLSSMKTGMTVLLKKLDGSFNGAVAVGADILAVERDLFVGCESRAFEPLACGGLIIQLADIKLAAVGQSVAATDGEHASAGVLANDDGASRFLQGCDENFRCARSSLRSEDDNRNGNGLDGVGSKQHCGARVRLELNTPVAIREASQAFSCGQESGRDLRHRFGFAPAIVAQVNDESAHATQFPVKRAHEIHRD